MLGVSFNTLFLQRIRQKGPNCLQGHILQFIIITRQQEWRNTVTKFNISIKEVKKMFFIPPWGWLAGCIAIILGLFVPPFNMPPLQAIFLVLGIL